MAEVNELRFQKIGEVHNAQKGIIHIKYRVSRTSVALKQLKRTAR